MRILITAGPTREPIDAVRFISNRSSGKMGLALARAAALGGHEVTLLLGPVGGANGGFPFSDFGLAEGHEAAPVPGAGAVPGREPEGTGVNQGAIPGAIPGGGQHG